MENKTQSIYKKVVSEQDKQDELKTQVTIDLTPWDSSKMDGYVEGSPVLKGFTCKFATLKPNKKYPKSAVYFDPANSDVRNALSEMYSAYDKALGRKE